jgi:predicted DNA-binding transcriptional regulator AlpA
MSTRQKQKVKQEFESLDLQRMLNKHEVARFLHVSERSIERWILGNQIGFPCGIKIGGVRRWRRDEIEEFSRGAVHAR